MPHPPVLTPERIDAMISGVAEVCFAAVQEAGRRLHAAPDMGDFERAGRTLNGACRNLRQTIAMKQRHDREQAALAADRRREAETGQKAAQRARDDAAGSHKARVRRHFERVLWTEYDEDDAQERFDDIDERLDEFADDAEFLETPVETLITRLAEEFGVGEHEDEAPEERVAPDSTAEDAETAEEPSAASTASANSLRPLRPLRLNPAEADPSAEAPPEPEPPPRPPDPPPEPYIPPWDRIPPGRRPPGSSSWMG